MQKRNQKATSDCMLREELNEEEEKESDPCHSGKKEAADRFALVLQRAWGKVQTVAGMPLGARAAQIAHPPRF